MNGGGRIPGRRRGLAHGSAADDESVDLVSDRDIVSTRIFGVPRERLFRAFTDAELLARWWGPKGFTNRFGAFEPRPGGAWRFVMRGPDGTEYQMTKRFVEVVPPERIVLDHIQEKHDFRMTISLEEVAGGTRLTWRMRFESAAAAEQVRAPIVEANEQNFDRLEEQLAALG